MAPCWELRAAEAIRFGNVADADAHDRRAGGQSPTNPSCVPAAPGNLQVAVNGGTRVFTWNAVSGVQDYFIQIGSASGASNLLNTNTTQTAYTWTGGGVGTFFARVYGRNSCGSGPNSTEVVFN